MSINSTNEKVAVIDNTLRILLWTTIVSSIICIVLLFMANTKRIERIQLRSEFQSVLVK